MPRYADLTERILANSVLDPEGGDCWIWTGQRDHNGYGRLSFREACGPRNQQAHRVAYTAFKGEPVPASWDVHHTCRNRACVNPAHLEAMWHKTNCATGNRNNHHSGAFKRRKGNDHDPA